MSSVLVSIGSEQVIIEARIIAIWVQEVLGIIGGIHHSIASEKVISVARIIWLEHIIRSSISSGSIAVVDSRSREKRWGHGAASEEIVVGVWLIRLIVPGASSSHRVILGTIIWMLDNAGAIEWLIEKMEPRKDQL